LAIFGCYYLLFAVASLFDNRDLSDNSKAELKIPIRKYAVLIPGYKEDSVIIDVAKKALEQNYPKELMDVIVIADSFKQETLESLRSLPIKVIEVSFDVSTKSKALRKAMDEIGNDYNIALILDADNVMESNFIELIDLHFDKGYIAVQGHRVAKNLNTSFAVLDAISEEINNSIFRTGHINIGLSSALIGSGMAFEYPFFKQRMSDIDAIGGFDKELELTLLRDNHKISYAKDAIVYDEKVQKAEVFANQRRRWLSAQFVYFKRFALSGFKHLIVNGNIDFFDKVIQMISPPRILLLFTTVSLSLINFALSYFNLMPNLIIHYSGWLTLFAISLTALMIATPKKYYDNQTFYALKTLPKAAIIMYKSLFKLKGANKKFIHTQHGV
jgi:cellulose synthase/poly-beta-1,6-N-acetylglucosamine synthase-like glycosyltransferase